MKIDGRAEEGLPQVPRYDPHNTEAENQQREHEFANDHQPKRGTNRRKLNGKDKRKAVNFKFPWELDARLDHYVADLGLKKHRDVDRTEIVVKALDEFLSKEGY